MKLLIVTQKVDIEDGVLGFFHRWTLEFAKHYEKITVITLFEGKHNLPTNVNILSLGKEKRVSRIRYVVQFYRYILRERRNYDVVFVHMNPEYIVLGGLFWKLWRKKTALWYNHKKGGVRARISASLSDAIFYTSPFAFMNRFAKAMKMGAGIDTTHFIRDRARQRKERSILSLGRISPVKNIDILINALNLLEKNGVQYVASIYGDHTERDYNYYDKVKEVAKDIEKKGKVSFHKGIPNYKAPEIFNNHEIFVNMTPSGSFDKTILEAMASSMLVLTCNESFRGIIPDNFMVEDGNSVDLAQKLKYALDLDEKSRREIQNNLRGVVLREHDVAKVVLDVVRIIT